MLLPSSVCPFTAVHHVDPPLSACIQPPSARWPAWCLVLIALRLPPCPRAGAAVATGDAGVNRADVGQPHSLGKRLTITEASHKEVEIATVTMLRHPKPHLRRRKEFIPIREAREGLPEGMVAKD